MFISEWLIILTNKLNFDPELTTKLTLGILLFKGNKHTILLNSIAIVFVHGVGVMPRRRRDFDVIAAIEQRVSN
jgi:hypothetical protein